MTGKIRPGFKLWFSSAKAQGVFGDGKWRLLNAIDKAGSLTAASRQLSISYRKAWGDLNKAQKCLKVNLIQKQRGGKAGGRTVLTDQGKKWLAAYSKFRTDIEKTVEESYQKYFKDLAG